MRWSEKETYQFVKIYLKYEHLWNHEHAHYRLKNEREKSYRNIIAEFEATTRISLSVTELKIKIKNLRSTYIQEVAKIKQRSSPEFPYTPTIKWFADWHKCFNKTTDRTADSSYNENDDDEQLQLADLDSQKVWVSDETEQDIENDSDPFSSQVYSHRELVPIELKSEICNSDIKEERGQIQFKSKKKSKRRSPSMDNSDVTFRGSMDSSSDVTKEDEFDIYGKYIASQLRQMELQKALRVQLQIQSLVSEARISEISGHH